jgi:hypothetical protein
MSKRSFKVAQAELLKTKLIAAGWTSTTNEMVFVKFIDATKFAVTTLMNASISLHGERLGQVYVPRVFLVFDEIEASYNSFVTDSKIDPMWPGQAGTLWLAPDYYRLGCPDFFSTDVPLAKPMVGGKWYTLNSKCKNWDQANHFFISDRDHYLFKPLSASSKSEKEFYSQNPLIEDIFTERTVQRIETLVADIEGSVNWLLERANSKNTLIEFARASIGNLNKALLFGASWPFRIVQLLLAQNCTDDAQSFYDFLVREKWSYLLRLNKDVAEARMQTLFTFYSNIEVFQGKPQLDRDEVINKFCRMVDKKADRNGEKIVFDLCIFGGGLPGLNQQIDEPLFRLEFLR